MLKFTVDLEIDQLHPNTNCISHTPTNFLQATAILINMLPSVRLGSYRIGRWNPLSPPLPAGMRRRRRFTGFEREIQNGFSAPHFECGTIISPRRIHIRVIGPQPDPAPFPGRVTDLRRVLSPRPPPHSPVVPSRRSRNTRPVAGFGFGFH